MKRPLGVFALILALLGPGAGASSLAGAGASEAAGLQEGNADELLIVNCLLPGKLRRLGRRQTFMGRRKPVRTTALDCQIRGGEYTAYDRADYASALAVWLAEATGGSTQAQHYVGQIYEKGLGSPPDYESAALWYRRAAEQGHTASQTSLGYLYEQGLGVEADAVAALNWYREAAGLPEEFVLLESSELDELRQVQQDLVGRNAEIKELEKQLEKLQGQLEEARRTEQTLQTSKRQEQVRLTEVVDDLRRELNKRYQSVSRSQRRLAQLERQIEQLKTTPAQDGSAVGPLPGLDFGPYHALVIGNGAYRELPEIGSATADARAMARLLETKYNFTVRLLLDATRYQIMTALNKLREELTDADNLLVFYAGHSQRDEVRQRGWWQPVDADPVSRVNWISNQVLSDHLQLISAKHALVVADAAYQTTLTRSSISSLPRGLSPKRQREYMKSMLGKTTRLVLTSGQLHPVASGKKHSVFSANLIEILEGNEGVLSASAIYRQLSRGASREAAGSTAARFAPLRWANHEGGSDFFFLAKGGG